MNQLTLLSPPGVRPPALPGTANDKPKELEPFPFQSQMIKELYSLIKAHQRQILMVAPTGSGKTFLSALILKDATVKAKKPIRCVFLVDLNCLIDQTVAELEGLGVPCAVLQGSRSNSKKAKAKLDNSRVIVASVQTITARMKKHPVREILGDVGLFFEDECHTTSQSRLADALREEYKIGTVFIGLTATPWLPGTKKWLGQKYDVKVVAPPVSDLIRMGRVVPAQTFSVDGVLDVEHLDIDATTGDFSESQQANQIGQKASLRTIVSEWKRLGENRPTAAYCPKVQTAKDLAKEFNEQGIRAEWQNAGIPLGIDGKAEHETGLETRAAQDYRLKRGITKVVCSVGTQVKGWNLKSLGCVMLVRATNVASLFCLDMQTEILTIDGWKKCNEVAPGSVVAGFDRQDRSIRWVSALDKIVRPVSDSEKMVEFANHHINFRVSDQHNLLWRRRDRNEKTQEWHITTAIELRDRKAEFYLPVSGMQQGGGVDLSDAEIRFIGLWITDGTRSGKDAIFLIQSEHHARSNAYIKQVLSDCGFDYSVRPNTGHTQYSETSPRLWYYIKRGRGADRKRLPGGLSRLDPYLDKDFSPLLEKMDDRQLGIFLEAANVGDGLKYKNRAHDGRIYDGHGNLYTQKTLAICCGNRVMADRLQSLCVRRGYSCNISTLPSGHMVLHIVKADSRMIGGSGAKDRSTLQVTDPKSGEMVWCVETETGTIVTRRNGKVVVMGNCQISGRGSRTCDSVYWMPDVWGNPGGKKENYILLDYGGNLSRFAAKGLNLNTLGEVPDRDYDISEPRQRRVELEYKYCPECDEKKERKLLQFAKICPNCGYEFSSQDEEEQESLDLELELREWFDEKSAYQAAWIRSKRRTCFNQNISPDWAAEQFHHKFGFIAPASWQLHAILNDRVLARPVTDDDRAEFVQYLLDHQPDAKHKHVWMRHHFYLEFGEHYDPKIHKPRKGHRIESIGWWTVFNLPKRCNIKELKNAYRRLAKDFHPDTAGDEQLEEMKRINGAYEEGKRMLTGM